MDTIKKATRASYETGLLGHRIRNNEDAKAVLALALNRFERLLRWNWLVSPNRAECAQEWRLVAAGLRQAACWAEDKANEADAKG
jgi:hypothetical protein